MAEAVLLKPVDSSCQDLRPLVGFCPVKDRYDLLVQSIHQGTMRDISHVYHVTDSKQKEKIICEGKIERKLLPLGNLQDTQYFVGVFVECNLSTSDDILPEYSPFGSERLKLPIRAIKGESQRLFFHSCSNNKDGNRCVLLVLLRDKDDGNNPPEFVTHFLHEIDLKSNPLLQLDFNGNTFKYMHYHDSHRHPIWLELAILGDVSVTSEQEWDHVRHIPPPFDHWYSSH